MKISNFTPLLLCTFLLLQACGSDSNNLSSSMTTLGAQSSTQSSAEASSSSESSSSAEASSSSESSSSSEISSSVMPCSVSSQASSANETFPDGVAQQLPQLCIQVENNQPIDTKETYLNADMVLIDKDFERYEGITEIRGRGNTTWTMPKKPYRVKLATKASLLDMPANRHWVLLANYSDKTLMRNDVVFHLGETMGMEYTPRSSFVDLHINGLYQGLYQLTEHIRIDQHRINIPELKEGHTDPERITGGYLLEVDSRRGEDFCFDSAHPDMAGNPMVFCAVNPETLLEAGWEDHRAYIENYIAQTESAIFAPDFTDPETGYAAFIDVDSAINYYLINELIKNVDGNLRLSTFLYKKRDGKLTFGPLWDFDLALGNVNYDDADNPEGWHILTANWYSRLFQDPAFATAIKDRWNWMKNEGVLDGLFERIDTRTLWLSQVQKANFELWDILNIEVWPNRVVTGTYQGEVDAMKEWLQKRINWIDAQLNSEEWLTPE
jgi:hypothetical protein